MSEITCDVNSVGRTKVIDDKLLAFTTRLQTLLLMNKGTMPNDPDMGIGIKTYVYEFADGSTIATLRSEIDKQIKKYIPNPYPAVIDVEMANDPHRKNAKIFVVAVKVNSEDRDGTTVAIIMRGGQGNKIVSSIASY